MSMVAHGSPSHAHGQSQKRLGTSGLSGAVKVVVRTFLEEKHYSQLFRTLSQEWANCHSLTAAVALMKSHNVPITPEEERRFAEMQGAGEEERIVSTLVLRMPQGSREQFEHFFLQLSLIATTTTRIRDALESGDPELVEEVLESAENVGILSFILKMAVAQAGQEVKLKEKDHDEWLSETDVRMAPLLQSQATSMGSQKELAQKKAQLGAYRVEANEKSKKVLLGIVGGKTSALAGACTSAWAEYTRRNKRELEVRKEYEEEIDQVQKLLMDFKMKQLGNVRNLLMRNAEGARGSLVMRCYTALKKETKDTEMDAGTKKAVKDAEKQLAMMAAKHKGTSSNVLQRMTAGSNETLLTNVFKNLVLYGEDYKKNREVEDKVKAAENRVKDFLDKSKAGAKNVLNKMSHATDTGIITEGFKAWNDFTVEELEHVAMQEAIGEKASKLNGFASRNKGSAMSEMIRMQGVMEDGTKMYAFHYWRREVKVDRIRRCGKDKDLKRKQQLVNVKGLFQNFASELDHGLRDGTPRVDPSLAKPKKGPK